MAHKKLGKRLLSHCAALKAILVNYTRLIAATAGQWRLMFEARAAAVRKELGEVCDENTPAEGSAT